MKGPQIVHNFNVVHFSPTTNIGYSQNAFVCNWLKELV